MTTSDPARDEDALAYVLGIESEFERRAFERRMAGDPALGALVRDWQERLVALSAATPPIEPRPELFAAIEQGLASAFGNRPAQAGSTDLRSLTRSRSIWRSVAVASGAIAAALAMFIVAERKLAPATGRSFVAVVNRSGDLPGLIVRVDGAAGIVQVRSVSAETPADHSLELWSVVSGQTPRSLGVVSGPTTKLRMAGGSGQFEDGLTLAVSVEPRGGSPTGAPTGPVVYSGKLIAEAP